MQTPFLVTPFKTQKTIALTTYRRNGEAVSTAVHIIVDGDIAVVRTWDTSGVVRSEDGRYPTRPDRSGAFITIPPDDQECKLVKRG